jgi:hypothetical protein
MLRSGMASGSGGAVDGLADLGFAKQVDDRVGDAVGVVFEGVGLRSKPGT